MGLPVNFEGAHPELIKDYDDGGVTIRKGGRVEGSPCSGSSPTDPGSPSEAWGLSAEVEVEESTAERLRQSPHPVLED